MKTPFPHQGLSCEALDSPLGRCLRFCPSPAPAPQTSYRSPVLLSCAPGQPHSLGNPQPSDRTLQRLRGGQTPAPSQTDGL